MAKSHSHDLVRTAVLAIVAASAVPYAVRAQTVVEQSAEHRFQLDFQVPDAALRAMLPAGWEPMVATQGAAKDANLRMIFIDRVAVVGPDGKPVGKGNWRLVYLAAPVKQTSGGANGQMIIAGLTENAAEAPGAFGVMKPSVATSVKRTASAADGTESGAEDWSLKSASGEFMQVHVEYVRGGAMKGGAEVKFYDPANPAKYQIFKTEQAIDIMRNATTNPPDHVKAFSYKAGGGKIAALFDGTEKVLSWDLFPWYVRTVSAP